LVAALPMQSPELVVPLPMQRPERQLRDLRPALVFLSGELIAVPIPLEREEVILGRALGADVRINDYKASRRHAKVAKVLNETSKLFDYVLTDFGSRNGTYLNGDRISEVILQNGDKITIGEHIREIIEKTEFSVIRQGRPASKHHVTMSIGISSFPDDSKDPIELVEMADSALYRAKREGRNRVCAYRELTQEELSRQLPPR